MRKKIKTQSDFENRMRELQDAVAQSVRPIDNNIDKLSMELTQLNIQKSELIVALQEQRTHWENIMRLKNIRDEKIACLAEGRRLKLELSKVGGGISRIILQIKKLRMERKETIRPLQDEIHDLCITYPKGSLPLIAK